VKLKKIQSTMKNWIDSDRKAQLQEADAIKELLGKLKKKERHLRERMASCKDKEEHNKLNIKLLVCHAQREKGLALLKEFKSE
jgi:hypothetical protein